LRDKAIHLNRLCSEMDYWICGRAARCDCEG